MSNHTHDHGNVQNLKIVFFLNVGFTLSTHLVIVDETPADDIRRIRQVSQQIINDLHLEHVTIAVEYAGEDCPMRLG